MSSVFSFLFLRGRTIEMYKENAAFLFDFDGVLVDSTETKTNAYKELFKSYGPEIVSKIVAYHQQHGGISRVDKIIYAHKHFIDEPFSQKKAAKHAQRYSELVFEKVVKTNWIRGAEKFVKLHFQHIPLFVISGTPEAELTEVVKRRNMDHYFKEVLGSPIRKPEHIRSLVARYNLDIENCFFIGDALTDYYAAKETGMPFIGIQGEVDFPEGTTVLPDCTTLMETMVQFWAR
jgi:HAD superfamily hydrolase (TIGR01549 family)